MKKYILYLFTGCILALTNISCSDFFDNEPDNIKTMDQVFQERESTLRFMANIYSYIRQPYQWSNQTIWTGISDELDVTYPDYEISKINLGNLAPDKEAVFYGNLWTHYYNGIRAATYFMNRVEECGELGFIPGANNLRESLCFRDEARALRAWFYFCLIRQYGPVVILSDDLIEPDAPVGEMQFPRSSVKTCFDYIISELDAVIAQRNIVDHVGGANLKDSYGHVTIAMCKALKARTLMYAASDFYNRDRTLPLFRNFKNIDDTDMFDYTDTDRKQRWEAAKKATEEVFSYPFSLFVDPNGGGPFESYQKLFLTNNYANKEIIYAIPARPGKGGSRNFWEMYLACTPRLVPGAWNGWGPLQEVVDSYFTKTGYPLLKGADGKLYAEDGSYEEDGFSTADGDNGYTQRGTFKMYTNREPRFYISICFNNSRWLANNNQSTVQFYYGGNSGRNTSTSGSRNYSQTGYLCRKFVAPDANVSDGGSQPDNDAIIFRLGEFYLNYAEILNEIDYTANRSEILQYLNAIRTRAGVPIYGANIFAGEVPVPKNYEAMREAIRRERRVELAFEEARYFDCIRWGIAHLEFDGDKHGMNANDSRGESVFHQRTVLENRKFKEHNLLWPIPLSDIYKGKLLVQNPNWSGISSANMDD